MNHSPRRGRGLTSDQQVIWDDAIRIADMPDLGTFTDTSSIVGEHAGSGRFTAASLKGYFLPLTGGTMTGGLTVSVPAATPAFLALRSDAGQYRYVQASTGLLTRWQILLANNAVEAGANTGSDFQIARFNDSGVFMDFPLTINRASGSLSASGVTISPPTGWAYLILNRNNQQGAQILTQTAGSSRWSIEPGDAADESGANAGSNFLLSRYSDNGVFIDNPFSINRATGQVVMPNTLIAGDVTVARGGSVTTLMEKVAELTARLAKLEASG